MRQNGGYYERRMVIWTSEIRRRLLLITFIVFSFAASAKTDTMYFSQKSLSYAYSYKNMVQVSVERKSTDSLNLTLIVRNVSKNPIGLPYRIDEFESDDEGIVCLGCSADVHDIYYKYRTYVLYPNECDTTSVTYKKMTKYRVFFLLCTDMNRMIKSIPENDIIKDSFGRTTYINCINGVTPLIPQSRIYIENLRPSDEQSPVKIYGWDLKPTVPVKPIRKSHPQKK